MGEGGRVRQRIVSYRGAKWYFPIGMETMMLETLKNQLAEALSNRWTVGYNEIRLILPSRPPDAIEFQGGRYNVTLPKFHKDVLDAVEKAGLKIKDASFDSDKGTMKVLVTGLRKLLRAK